MRAEDLTDPTLAETLALSVQGDFECGLTDHICWPGLWFDNFLNSSTSRPNALTELRAQLVDVYADPCASGTGPTWVLLQLPSGFCPAAVVPHVLFGGETGSVSVRGSVRGGQLPPGDRSQ